MGLFNKLWCLPIFSAVFLLAVGVVKAQSTGAIMMCSVMTTNAESLMSIRQKGVPRATVDATVADDPDGAVKEFTQWMVDAAYSFDVVSTPALVSYVTTEFAGLVYDECIVQNWPSP